MLQTHELKAVVRAVLEMLLPADQAEKTIQERLRALAPNEEVAVTVARRTPVPAAAVIRIGRSEMLVEL